MDFNREFLGKDKNNVYLLINCSVLKTIADYTLRPSGILSFFMFCFSTGLVNFWY